MWLVMRAKLALERLGGQRNCRRVKAGQGGSSAPPFGGRGCPEQQALPTSENIPVFLSQRLPALAPTPAHLFLLIEYLLSNPYFHSFPSTRKTFTLQDTTPNNIELLSRARRVGLVDRDISRWLHALWRLASSVCPSMTRTILAMAPSTTRSQRYRKAQLIPHTTHYFLEHTWLT